VLLSQGVEGAIEERNLAALDMWLEALAAQYLSQGT
jgi:hypothetical protein